MSHVRGSNLMLHTITWNWATGIMVARWPNTKKVRALDAWIARGKDVAS